MTTLDLVKAQLSAEEQDRSYALVTIIETQGSVPRERGKMIVYANGDSEGTIGGSAIELWAKEDAVKAIASGNSAKRTYEMPQLENAAVKGGVVTVFIEPSELRPLLLVSGGGHVGCAVLKLAKFLGYETWLVDTREAQLIQESVDTAGRFIPLKAYKEGIEQLEIPRKCSVVLCGASHEDDYQALSAVLSKETEYVGMLGSRRKIATIFERLKQEGTAEKVLQRIYTPIGLEIGAKTPEELSVAIMGQIMKVRSENNIGAK